MRPLTCVPADDPELPELLRRALAGELVLAPLPTEPAQADRVRRMLRPEDGIDDPAAAVVVSTSGSTGAPKGVVLSADAIIASARATHHRLGGPGSWTLALPAHYVAGLMVIARALVSQDELGDPSPRLQQSPRLRPSSRLHRAGPHLAEVAGAFELPGPHYLSLVPTQLVAALESPAMVSLLARFDAVLLGGAALPEPLRRSTERSGIALVSTYGMSETSGGCVYDGTPLPGVSASVDPATSRIDLAGPMVFRGYHRAPELTSQTLGADSAGTPTVHTRDRGRLDGARLTLLGRVDDVVISGGVNVDLARLESLAEQDFGPLAALGVPDEKWGTRVVLALTADLPLTRVRQRLAAAHPGLDPAALPRGLVSTSRLPLTSSGKIDRQSLIGWFTDPPAGVSIERL